MNPIMVADAQKAIGAAVGMSFLGIWVCLAAIGGLVGLFFLVVWILMLIDCIKRKPEEFPDSGENAKTIWLIALLVSWVFFHAWWIVGIVYYFVVKRKVPLENKNKLESKKT